MSQLKICSYNCRSARSNFEIIKNLTNDNYDIIFLQETFLTNDILGMLDNINNNYNSILVPAIYSDKVLENLRGRPSGGLACLYRKNSHFGIEVVKLDDRFMIINCKVGNKNIILVNVYMPYDDHGPDFTANYLHILADVETVLDNIMYDALYLCGDFNADPFGSRAWSYVTNFSNDLDLRCFDVESLNANSFTYISNDNMFCKWLDHVIGTSNCNFNVNYIHIQNDVVGSDHFPIHYNITIKDIHISATTSVHKDSVPSSRHANVDLLSKENLHNISDKVMNTIKPYVDNLYVNCCIEPICHNIDHRQVITDVYTNLVNEVRKNFDELRNNLRGNNNNFDNNNINSNINMDNQNNLDDIPVNNKNTNYTPVPGWNRRVKTFYRSYRIDFLNWVKGGRDRNSLLFFIMQDSRLIFKTSLHECKINRKQEIAISITDNFNCDNSKAFWKDVNKNKKFEKKSAVIDGATNESEIVDILTNRFSSEVPDDSNDNSEQELISELLLAMENERCFHLTTSVESLKIIIKLLNDGTGHDGIHAKFLKSSSDNFLQGLSLFINSCLSHGFFPSDLLMGVILPRIKNASGNCTDSKNYRPIMNSSCILKIIELYIQNILAEKLNFNVRQFGYTSGVSTSEAAFVLKETIYERFNHKEATFALFIDLSNAFMTVNHFKLAKILKKRKIPPDLIWVILKFLRNQNAVLKWGNTVGKSTRIDRGVRQGGILSPLFFKIYLDDILELLSKSENGVRLGYLNINILAYADDIVLLSRNQAGLDSLYKILKFELKNLDLIINFQKTKCMIFSKRKMPYLNIITLDNDNFDICTTFKYLGYNLSYNLCDGNDITVRLKSLYLKFFSIRKTFYNLPEHIMLFLFNSFCSPNYGLNIWNLKNILNKKDLKSFEVGYAKCIKNIYGLNKYTSSHFIFNASEMLLFKHYACYVQCRYFKDIFSNAKGIIYLIPSLKGGVIATSLQNVFKSSYNVSVFDNDIEALKARIFFVQKNEESI